MEKVNRISVVRPAPMNVEPLDDVKCQAIILDAMAHAGVAMAPAEALEIARQRGLPNALKLKLQNAIPGKWVHVCGSVDNRMLFIGTEPLGGVVANLGAGLKFAVEDRTHRVTVDIDTASKYVGKFQLTHQQLEQLVRPKTLLVALYHPENFPLPRFALGISDLARSIRDEWLGEVALLDMQLGETVQSILDTVDTWAPDIVGVSATFGQADVLDLLLAGLAERTGIVPKIIVGGSLGSLLCDDLLTSRRVDFVATGAGELTVRELARHVVTPGTLDQIPDCAYWDDERGIVKTGRSKNKDVPSMIPELDLLPATLEAGGVMQLESSRGCSYACSFCPREHKGMWAGENAGSLVAVLPQISAIFSAYPSVDRRIFLVDEEFVGYQVEELAQGRCIAVASQMASYGFRFETSSRIDQVSRPRRDKAWHLERMKFWQQLVEIGLDRCLFGVESGVDSILHRFNKKTTSEQNAIALRMLSLLGVPIRCTYITFDPLMSIEELDATLQFLGRTDLILKPASRVDGEYDMSAIYDIATNAELAAQHTTGIPFYQAVSYMGVSMEALIGSKYLEMVEAEGLAGATNHLMGRREVTYLDERIGRLSVATQYWVDRNFSLDYVLKSIEKCTGKAVRQHVRDARVILKIASFSFITDGYAAIRSGHGAVDHFAEMQERFHRLRHEMQQLVRPVLPLLDAKMHDALATAFDEWSAREEWKLINGMCIAA